MNVMSRERDPKEYLDQIKDKRVAAFFAGLSVSYFKNMLSVIVKHM